MKIEPKQSRISIWVQAHLGWVWVAVAVSATAALVGIARYANVI